MIPPVSFTPAAREDIEEIWLYLAIEADEEIADRFITKLHDKCHSIGRSPKGFRLRPELAPELRSFPFKSYVIFYLEKENDIEVIRILHASRDLGAQFSK